MTFVLEYVQILEDLSLSFLSNANVAVVIDARY
jgi:hypothetical protein